MSPETPNRPESEFLNALKSHLAPHLFKMGVTISELVRLVFMSRTDLHRKLKRKTGMSASAYIRYARLNRAKKNAGGRSPIIHCRCRTTGRLWVTKLFRQEIQRDVWMLP